MSTTRNEEWPVPASWRKSPGAPRGARNGNYRHGLRTIVAIVERRHAAEVRRALRLLRQCVSVYLIPEKGEALHDLATGASVIK